jgi:hypothetical protein
VSLRSQSAVFDAVFAAYPHLVTGLDRHPDPGLGIDPTSLTGGELFELVEADRWLPWTEALQRVGNCVRPILLRGSSERVNKTTGEIVSTYSSAQEPLGVTHIRCGNRRESACPPCSRLHAGDTYQMIRAGVVGGKTVPTSVVDNPLVFATLTAPSFGKVHGRRDGTQAWHPRTRGPATCEHGRPRTCTARHDDQDELLGQPLCPDCYDYASQLVWQWWAPALWRRFTIGLRRSIAKDLAIAATRLNTLATVQYAKVSEQQTRGAIHFHSLIRLDGPKTDEGFAPSPAGIDAARLARHIEQAALAVRLTVPGVDDHDPDRILAFGVQIDARTVRAKSRADDPNLGLSAEQVAGYLAKYVTKATGDDRDRAGDPHHRRIKRVARALARRAELTADPDSPYRLLEKWVHEYGYRGHFATKSRRFSITLGALRRARQRAQALLAEANRDGRTLDLAALEADLLADEDNETTVVIGQWSYVGTGWNNDAETTLALAAAARAREYDQWRAEQRRTSKQTK